VVGVAAGEIGIVAEVDAGALGDDGAGAEAQQEGRCISVPFFFQPTRHHRRGIARRPLKPGASKASIRKAHEQDEVYSVYVERKLSNSPDLAMIWIRASQRSKRGEWIWTRSR
jgi:hypothetical protein